MSDNHCSDSILIAFLDGELSIEQWQEGSKHLDGCWRCRARAQELEQTIVSINRVFSDADQAVAGSADRVRKRLWEAIDGPGSGNTPLSHKRRSGRAVLLLSMAGAAAAAVTGIVTIGPQHHESRPAIRLRSAPVALPQIASPQARLSLSPLPTSVTGPISRARVKIPAAVRPDDVEVEFRFALHRRGSDLSNTGIRIAQKNGYVVVTGVVEDVSERDQVADAVKEVSQPELITLDVLLPSEIDSTARAATPVALARPATPPEQPFRPELIARAGSEGRLTEISNTAISQVEQMTDIAWALRHLNDRFGPAVRASLKPESRRLLDTIEADYINDIRSLTGKLKKCLSPLFTSQPSGGAASEPSNVIEHVFTTRDFIEWLFADRPLSVHPGSLHDALQTLAADLNRLERSDVTPRPATIANKR